jgi:hypothetical protein
MTKEPKKVSWWENNPTLEYPYLLGDARADSKFWDLGEYGTMA